MHTMKKEIKKEIKDAMRPALEEMLTRKRGELRVFRFRSGLGKAKNVKEGREVRKAIARIQTRLGELNRQKS